ncbi:hypothetical protein [Streptococcus suis]
MNTRRMEEFEVLNNDQLSFVGGGVTPGWYAPIWFSDNLECKNGYAYNSANMKNGICRFNWNTIVNNVVANTVTSAISGYYGGHTP